MVIDLGNFCEKYLKNMLTSVFSFFLFISSHAFAQEVIDVTRHQQVTADDPTSARQKLMEDAIEVASLESIRGLIGNEKTMRSKDLITNKVIKKSDRYILSLKGQNFTKKGSDYAMDVDMKISLKGLRSLLLEQGLLYQMEGPPKVLPLVEITDRLGGRRFGWWHQAQGANKEHAFLSDQLDQFHKSLREELQKIGFYGMSPLSGRLSQSVPEAYRGENLQRADYLFLGEFFKSSIVIRGEIIYRAKPNAENTYIMDVRLQALHSGNGRLLAEVVRVYETKPSPSYRTVIAKKFEEMVPKLAEDLSAQLSESWKKGTFGASVVKLAVVGKISPRDLEEFKKTVILQVHDIKALRERWIEARKVTFDVDSSVLSSQLAQVLRTTQFAKFKVDVEDVSNEGLTIKVETR